MGILETLLNGDYRSPQQDIHLPRELSSKHNDLLKQIEASLGAAFLEEYWNNYCEIEYFQDLTHFREGFRLGALMMLELAGRL